MGTHPIKTQIEADKVFEYLVSTTVRVLKIDRGEAKKRVKALFASGILENGHPESRQTQMQIDAFLSIPSDTYSHIR